MITVKINGNDYEAREGSTILEVARENGVYIPTLCFMEGVSDIGSCRLCMVEAEGYDTMLPACRTKIKDGMVINTESELLNEYRKDMLKLILSNHNQDCMSCPANGSSASDARRTAASFSRTPAEKGRESCGSRPRGRRIRTWSG